MKIVVLDETDETYNDLLCKMNTQSVEVVTRRFSTSFSMVTYIYDDVKGDIDLLMINITDSPVEYIAVASAVQNYFPQIHVIFYSRINNYAQEIFDANPSYFLLYPFDNEKFSEAIQRVERNLQCNIRQQLTFRTKGQLFKIQINSIAFIESVGRKLNIYSQDGFREINMTMEEALMKLPKQFVQCHRSYIVNFDRVLQISEERMILTGNFVVPIARGRLKEIKSLFEKKDMD